MGKLYFRSHDRMMREERGEPLTYKIFFHINMAHGPYCKREAIVYAKNEFFWAEMVFG